jgi:superfamily II DNA or RNA helicase
LGLKTMNLLKVLKNNVPLHIFQRGENYYREERVQEYEVVQTDDYSFKIKARVRGTTMYNVQINLRIKDNKVSLSCDCSCPYNRGEICKHEMAVLFKFITEDYAALSQGEGNYHYNKLLTFNRSVQPQEKISLDYYIKGLLTESMVNFKITLKAELLSEKKIEELISYIHNPELYLLNADNIIDRLVNSDLVALEYIRKTVTSMSRTPGSILFPKNKSNFNFIMNLTEGDRVYLEETGEKVRAGKLLYPRLLITGNNDEIEIKPEENEYPVYRANQGRNDLSWSIIDGKIHPVELESIYKLPEKIKIPEKKRGEFLFEILPSLEENLELSVARNLKGNRLIERDPVIRLEFDYREQAIFCHTLVEIEDKAYHNSQILELNLDNRHYFQTEEPDVWYCWNLNALKILIEFLEYNNFHVHPEGFVIRDENEIQDFITDGFVHLPEEWEVETTPAFDQLEIVPIELDPVIEFKNDGDSINWFEFTISFNLGGKTYSYSQLKSMLRYNKQGEGYVRLGQSYYILQEGQRQKSVEQVLKLAEAGDNNTYRSNYYNLLYYRNLVEETGINFKGNRVFNQLEQDITGNNLVKEMEIPDEVTSILRGYQKNGYYWLRFLDKYRFGGILADDMGLGKTLQTLTFLKSISTKRPALVICPRTLLYNWSEEIEKFFPGTEYLVYYGNPEEREKMRSNIDQYELVITSYSIISRDYEEMQNFNFSYCILDEAQHIKNYRTKRARGVKAIRAGVRLALTGTPIENSVEELWSIMDYLMPGYLGNYHQFSNNYLNPIKKNHDEESLYELKKRVAPFILRRKKQDVLKELPDKMVNIQRVEMTKLQEDTYRVVLDEVKNNLFETVQQRGFDRSRINILTVLTRLRQICNHPALVLDQPDRRLRSGKMEALLEIVGEAIEGGHKLIVFSQFVQMLKLIREEFDRSNIIYEYLDGSTRNRMERVRNFNENEEIQVFLISLKAGGVGLNLTAADMVIHVDPWWNPMVERQATDRAHRIGQDKRVMVYKLITVGTVEEKMLKLQEKKEHIFNSVIEESASPINNITWQDIQELLEYRK